MLETSPLLQTIPITKENENLNLNGGNSIDNHILNGTRNSKSCIKYQYNLRDDIYYFIYNKYKAITNSANKKCYSIVPIVFLIVFIITAIVDQHGIETAIERESFETYFPDTTQQNVLDYLDIPCLKSELDYEQSSRRKNRLDLTNNKENINNDKQVRKGYDQRTNASTDSTDQSLPTKLCRAKCEATVSLIRHCEKDIAREHCSYVGYERSLYISTLFGNRTIDRWPVPAYIFALSPGERKNKDVRNWREVETVTPLSHRNNLTIDSSFGLKEKDALVKHIFALLRSGFLCGKLVLICWKHEDIPSLAESLGCGKEEGCPSKWKGRDYDSVWEIKYSYHKTLNSPLVANQTRRGKKKKKKDEKHKGKNDESHYDEQLWDKYPIWHIYGSIQSQGFDPLEFSKQMGDYQEGNHDAEI